MKYDMYYLDVYKFLITLLIKNETLYDNIHNRTDVLETLTKNYISVHIKFLVQVEQMKWSRQKHFFNF